MDTQWLYAGWFYFPTLSGTDLAVGIFEEFVLNRYCYSKGFWKLSVVFNLQITQTVFINAQRSVSVGHHCAYPQLTPFEKSWVTFLLRLCSSGSIVWAPDNIVNAKCPLLVFTWSRTTAQERIWAEGETHCMRDAQINLFFLVTCWCFIKDNLLRPSQCGCWQQKNFLNSKTWPFSMSLENKCSSRASFLGIRYNCQATVYGQWGPPPLPVLQRQLSLCSWSLSSSHHLKVRTKPDSFPLLITKVQRDTKKF